MIPRSTLDGRFLVVVLYLILINALIPASNLIVEVYFYLSMCVYL